MVAAVLADGSFEHEVRLAARRGVSAISPIDLRVAKAIGSKGYDKIRVSVISQDGGVDLRGLAADSFYNDSFKYRWEGAFDLGQAETSCGSGVYNRSQVVRPSKKDPNQSPARGTG